MTELFVIAGYVVCIGVLLYQRYVIIEVVKQNKEYQRLMKVAVVVGELEGQLMAKLQKENEDMKTAMRKI